MLCNKEEGEEKKAMQKVVAIAPNPSRAEREEKGPVKVYDSLYLGSRLDARNVRKLKALGITAVVDCAQNTRPLMRRILYLRSKRSKRSNVSLKVIV